MAGFVFFLIFAAIKLLLYFLQAAAREGSRTTDLPSIRSWRPDPDPGIQFLGPVAAPASGKGTQCQVCGSELDRDLVSCGACATPHHRECWDYNRGCSTYGCRRAA
jgi:hypothetical protein